MSTLFEVPAKGDGIHRDARFAKSGDRRFLLTRRWAEAEDTPYVLFCMLNPSTANAEKDDPTIRKCMKYARDWGYGALHVVNLFDFITPSPGDLHEWLRSNEDREQQRPLYLDIIRDQSQYAALTVCGWGTWGGWFPERAKAVHAMLHRPHALHITKDGHPGHPLYLKSNAIPQPFLPTPSTTHQADLTADQLTADR